MLKEIAADLKDQFCGFDETEFHEKASLAIQEEIELYLDMLELSQNMEEIIREESQKLKLTHLKKSGKGEAITEVETSIPAIQQDTRYSHIFSQRYPNLLPQDPDLWITNQEDSPSR